MRTCQHKCRGSMSLSFVALVEDALQQSVGMGVWSPRAERVWEILEVLIEEVGPGQRVEEEPKTRSLPNIRLVLIVQTYENKQ